MSKAKDRTEPYIRYIDNITILTNVDEEVELPNPVVAQLDNGAIETVYVEWEDKPIDVTEEAELIYSGRVEGYIPEVLCSIQVGRQTDNPPSSFPECIDQFGLPKRDIQTEDVPHIDDYQYFKAKTNRTLAEEYHLKQLRELVADQVILARDINHMRNAIIEIEKYIWIIQDQLDDIFDEIGDIWKVINEILETMVTDGENIGVGTGIFSHKSKNTLNFKTLLGEGIDIIDLGDEILLEAKAGDDGSGVCGMNTVAKSFKVCHEKEEFPTIMMDGAIGYTNFFNWQLVDMELWGEHGSSIPYVPSLLGVFGIGIEEPMDSSGWNGSGQPPSHGTRSSLYAGRFFKGNTDVIFEIKTGASEYSGFVVGALNKEPEYSKGIYKSNVSLIQSQLYEPLDIYSLDIGLDRRARRRGYSMSDDEGVGGKDNDR